MADSNLKRMSQEGLKSHDLWALRINREPERRRGGPRGWLLLGAAAVVAAGIAAYFVAGRGLRPKAVEVVTAWWSPRARRPPC